MELKIRRVLTQVEDIFVDGETEVTTPHRKAAIIFVVENPMAGTKGADLSEMTKASVEMGRVFGAKIRETMGDFPIEGYGKGGLVGLAGEAEHANAVLTTAFANPIRDAIGGAEAWISSFQKLAGPSETIDIPMNHKDDVYVRSHYDGMSVTVPRSPQADEIVMIFCVSSRARLNARVGGLTHEEVLKRKAAAL